MSTSNQSTEVALRAALSFGSVQVFYQFVAGKAAPQFDAAAQKRLFRVAALTGDRDLAAEAIDYLGMSVGTLREAAREALPALGKAYMKPMMVWLAERASLTPDDVRHKNNAALGGVVSSGSLEAARWLVETFGLAAADVQDAGAYNIAAECGHEEMLGWLVGRFGWGPVTAEAASYMHKRAGNRDQLRLCKYLERASQTGFTDPGTCPASGSHAE